MFWFSAERRRSNRQARRGETKPEDLERLTAEIGSVARYVSTLRREIGLLRANEIFRTQLPAARRDLSEIRTTLNRSVDAILTAAERLLAPPVGDAQSRSAEVEARAFEIMEACAFQDLAGQRLKRIDDALAFMERRVQRFALAVGASDQSGAFDRLAIEEEVRREMLIVAGPQASDAAPGQDAVDRLFA